jgi:hypothetical protein
MSRLGNIVLDAFLDGFTGAGLFGRLRWPGAPTEVIDSRGVEALYETGEFETNVQHFRAAVEDMKADRAAQGRPAAAAESETVGRHGRVVH